MQYLALLRGINVGGNNMIKMADLKKAFEDCGFKNVSTYINSGNVIFETDEKSKEKIVEKLENALTNKLNLNVTLVIRTNKELQQIIEEIPDEWKGENDLRCYIAYIKEPVTTDDVLKEIQLKEGVDTIKAGANVLYMSTKLSGLTKSGFTKLIGKKIFQEITIRNLNTSQKLLSLMEKNWHI